MKIAPFATEHFFAQYEFTTPYQLCNSDCETLSVEELLQMADVSMQDFGRLSLSYTESLGHSKLREMIAGTYAQAKTEDVVMLATPVVAFTWWRVLRLTRAMKSSSCPRPMMP